MIAEVGRLLRRIAIPLLVLTAVLVGVGLLITKALLHAWPFSVEDGADRYFAGHRVPVWTEISTVFSTGASTPFIIGALVVTAIALRLIFHRWRESAYVVTAVSVELIAFLITGLLIDRQRPHVPRLDPAPPTSSFPSGHTGAATALVGALVLLVARRVKRRWLRVLLAGLLCLIPVAVALARLYRGEHHPSDVIAGLANGAAAVGIASRGALDTDDFGQKHPGDPTAEEAYGSAGTRKRAAVVVNPTKVGDVEARRRRVSTEMALAGWADPLWLETSPHDSGRGMTRQALAVGVDVVFAAGGDGTVMAVVSELAGTGVPLAILPAGTGNLLARNLRLPTDLDEAIHVGLSGVDRNIDLGEVDGQRFAVMAGIGFDAKVMADAPDQLKAHVGWPAYVVSGLQHLRGRGMRVTIQVDGGEVLRRRARSVLIGNVGALQAGVQLIPHAEPDDGVLDVVVLTPENLGGWARVAGHLAIRKRDAGRYVEHLAARERVEVHAEHDEARQVDGDPIESGPHLVVTVAPRSLVVRVLEEVSEALPSADERRQAGHPDAPAGSAATGPDRLEPRGSVGEVGVGDAST